MDPLNTDLPEDQLVEQILSETSAEVTDDNEANQVSNPDEAGNDTNTEIVADNFKPEEWQLNYRGQTISPKDKQELINLAQKGYSFSQSMAVLNKEKEQMKEQLNQYQPYVELDRRFREDPRLQAVIQKALAEYEQTPETNQLADNPMLYELKSQLDEIKQFKAQQEQSVVENDLRSEIQELRNQYPNENWDAGDEEGTFLQHVLKHAYDNNIGSLQTAYRDLAFERSVNNAKAEALKEATRKTTGNQNAKVGGGRTFSTQKSEIKYDPSDGYDDLVNKALAMLG